MVSTWVFFPSKVFSCFNTIVLGFARRAGVTNQISHYLFSKRQLCDDRVEQHFLENPIKTCRYESSSDERIDGDHYDKGHAGGGEQHEPGGEEGQHEEPADVCVELGDLRGNETPGRGSKPFPAAVCVVGVALRVAGVAIAGGRARGAGPSLGPRGWWPGHPVPRGWAPGVGRAGGWKRPGHPGRPGSSDSSHSSRFSPSPSSCVSGSSSSPPHGHLLGT